MHHACFALLDKLKLDVLHQTHRLVTLSCSLTSQRAPGTACVGTEWEVRLVPDGQITAAGQCKSRETGRLHDSKPA